MHRNTAFRQVQYGGMCAYLIKEEDKNIEEPIARIAIKRYIPNNYSNYDEPEELDEATKKVFAFVAEPKIYGDSQFAQELNFSSTVENILNKSNKQTMDKDTYVYRSLDTQSWTDRDTIEYVDINNPKFDEFVKYYPTRINWVELVRNQKLPEKFIKKYLNDYFIYDADELLENQQLSKSLLEDIINHEEFKKYYWGYIAEYQPIDLEFAKKYKNQLDPYSFGIESNKSLSSETKQKILEIFK